MTAAQTTSSATAASTPENVGAAGRRRIYTRGPKEKQNTAIFVGGGSHGRRRGLFKAVKKRFFANFRVSRDARLATARNTTAAAGRLALLAKAGASRARSAVVLAGTGPVGMRAAAMLAHRRRGRRHHRA